MVAPSPLEAHHPGSLILRGSAPHELRLLGHLLPPSTAIRSPSPPIILGRTHSGKAVTLRGCHGPNLLGPKETYLVLQAYLGLHFPNERLLKFRDALVSYHNLTEWVWNTKWYRRTWLGWNPLDSPKARISWGGPSELAVTTRVGTIAIRADAAVHVDSRRGAEITKQLWIRVALKQLHTLESFHFEVLNPLANLLSLATAALTPIQSVRLLVPRKVRLLDPPRTVKVPVEVEVLFPRPTDRDPWRTTPGHMPFGLEHVQRRLHVIFNRWLTLYDALRFPLDLFFSVHNASAGYLEHRFLSLVQAAESYHSNRIGGSELTPREYEKRKQLVLARVPMRYHSWVKDKLRNDLSLRKRLEGLLDQASDTVKALVPDRAKVVDALDFLTNRLVHE